jgi:hypothetical protein
VPVQTQQQRQQQCSRRASTNEWARISAAFPVRLEADGSSDPEAKADSRAAFLVSNLVLLLPAPGRGDPRVVRTLPASFWSVDVHNGWFSVSVYA